jgi:C1A family cysteine protease
MSTTYGYRRDPLANWSNDFTFATDLQPKLSVKVSSGDVDMRPFCTDTNQYDVSGCAGNATADSIEILNRASNLPGLEASRMFVYSCARDLNGDLNRDEGTYITTCFDVLARFGICTEKDWAYDTSKVFVRPSLAAMRAATRHKIHSYYRIKSNEQSRLDEIVAALRAHHPVVFGTLIDQGFESFPGNPILNRPVGNTVGGHAMIIVGYVESSNLFIVKNSWGPTWREKGFSYFTPEYLTWSETSDLWVPTLGTDLTI